MPDNGERGEVLRLPAELSQALMASAIATSLTRAISVEASAPASRARRLLRELRFDQAPVTKDAKTLGWVRTAHLSGRGSVQAAMSSLADSAVLATTTPLPDVLPLVVQKGFVFLAGRAGLASFVVPSDLDRLAVRSYLYVLVADLEIALAHLVRQWVSEAVVIELLRDEQRERFEQSRRRGRETHAVEYMYLDDYSKIASVSPQLVDIFGVHLRELSRDLRRLNEVRTCIAHPSKSLMATFEPSDVVERAALAQALLARLAPLATELGA